MDLLQAIKTMKDSQYLYSKESNTVIYRTGYKTYGMDEYKAIRVKHNVKCGANEMLEYNSAGDFIVKDRKSMDADIKVIKDIRSQGTVTYRRNDHRDRDGYGFAPMFRTKGNRVERFIHRSMS